MSLADRFWSKVQRSDDCWLWTGTKPRGYGMLRVGRRMRLAHRISWEIHRGQIPEGLDICHVCDVPACVRPDHLFLGTAKDNSDDARAKGRWRPFSIRGESHHNAKLSDAQVEEVRRIRSARSESIAALARRLGVATSTIKRICNGRVRRASLCLAEPKP